MAMSPVSLWNVSESGARVHAPLTLSDTVTSPATLNWANQPTSRSPACTGRDRVKVWDVALVPDANAAPCWKAGVLPPPPPDPPAGTNVAATAYQSVAAPSVAVPCWAPAAAEVTSCWYTVPLLVPSRGVNATPCVVPGVTPPGFPPVVSAEYTSSPAGTELIIPVPTAVPLPLLMAA